MSYDFINSGIAYNMPSVCLNTHQTGKNLFCFCAIRKITSPDKIRIAPIALIPQCNPGDHWNRPESNPATIYVIISVTADKPNIFLSQAFDPDFTPDLSAASSFSSFNAKEFKNTDIMQIVEYNHPCQ